MRLLRAEALKLFKDKIFLLALGGMTGAPLLMALSFIFGKADLVRAGKYTADWFVDMSLTFQGLMLGPMMMAILGAQIMTMEYRQKTIKSLIPLPCSMAGIYGAKSALSILAVAISLFATGVATLGLPAILGASPAADSSWAEVVMDVVKTEGILLPMLCASVSFSLLVSLVARNFVAPLAASVIALVAGMFALQTGKERFIWTALPLKSVTQMLDGKVPTEALTVTFAYFVLFVAVGLVWTKLNRRPE